MKTVKGFPGTTMSTGTERRVKDRGDGLRVKWVKKWVDYG